MKDSAAEAKILELIESLKEKGRVVPVTVAALPNFPFKTFEETHAALASRKILIQRFAFEYLTGVFDVLATPIQRFMSTFYLGLTYLGPVIAILLAIFYSWWCLLGILALPIGMSKMKGHYNHVIFSSAFKSELIFCFLYYVKQISLTTLDYKTCYYWGHENEADSKIPEIHDSDKAACSFCGKEVSNFKFKNMTEEFERTIAVGFAPRDSFFADMCCDGMRDLFRKRQREAGREFVDRFFPGTEPKE